MSVNRNDRRAIRLAGAIALALAFAWAGGASAPAWAEADTVVRAAPTDAGGRIVFQWPSPVRQNAVIGGKTLVVTFGEPFGGDPSAIARALPSIVQRVDLSRDQRVLTIYLNAPYALDRRIEGSAMVLLLTPPGAQQPSATAAEPQLETRYGRHQEFDRLVFKWPRSVDYEISQTPGAATVTFERGARVDLPQLRAALTGSQIGVEMAPGSDRLVIRLSYPEDRSLRHFRDGAAVVIDLTRSDAAPIATDEGSEAEPARPSQVEQPEADGGADQAGEQTTPPPTQAAEEWHKAPGPRAIRPEEDDGDAAVGDTGEAPEGSEGASEMEIAQPPATVERSDTDGQYGPPLDVMVSRSDATVELRLPFGTAVPAAVFRRAGAVWAVFGEARRLSLPTDARLGGGVYEIEQLANRRASVLRISSGEGVVPSVSRNDTEWVIRLGAGTMAPRSTAEVEAESHATRGGRLTVRGPGGSPLRLPDPHVGDAIVVVPFQTPGLGVQPGRRFAQFRLLPTVQGVVVEPHSDGITVVSTSDGVEITAGDGLRLSPRASATPQPSTFEGTRLFEFGEWLGGRPGDFPASYERVKQQLLHRIASASDAERNNRRLELARFYFAHGLGADAEGVLRKVIEDDPDLLDRPRVRALRGGARLLNHDHERAADDLNHSALDAEPEVALWRGALAARQRNWRSAAANFGLADGLLRYYPRTLKLEFALMAAEAELAAGEVERARMFLSMVEEDEPRGRSRQEADYLGGVILERTGQTDAALDQWARLIKTGDGPSRVKAAVSSINLRLSRGMLEDVKGSIESLDRLRFAWRGDHLEFAVLDLLGRLYLVDAQYRRGFETLSRAARLYPTIASEEAVEEKMRAAFADLYLQGGADRLSPIKALALFDDYKTLMPRDERGDQMIASLVDRLVSVDLLGRAANLLTRQIEARLSGVERARVGARLALVYLLDDQPRRAINAIEATRVPDMPDDLVAQRKRLSARGFAEMDRRDRALELLAEDATEEAEYIRLDIFWRAQDWAKAAGVLTQLADRIEVAGQGEALGDGDSRTVLRLAVAMALAGDEAGLRGLRQRFGPAMEAGPYREAYAILTSEMDRDGVVSYEAIADTLRDVDRYQAFLASYRERLQADGLSKIN